MIISVAIAVAVLIAALAGVLVLMRVGMNHEHDRYLSSEAPTRIAAVARLITGLYVHMPDRAIDADDATARAGGLRQDSPTVAAEGGPVSRSNTPVS